MAKRFMYVCAGLFLLALSYYLGARGATAQVVSENPVVAADHDGYLVSCGTPA